jgi:DNA-directed RNA polymerase subunit RPC12/RpoP
VVKRFSEWKRLQNYIIVVCSKCGGYLLAKNEQKTRTCPYCGLKILLRKALKVASAGNAEEASILLRRLKEENAAKKGKLGFKGDFKKSH